MSNTEAAPHDPKQMRKLVIASVLGNALEWYDFFLYGTAAALVFGPLFFRSAATRYRAHYWRFPALRSVFWRARWAALSLVT